MIVLIIVITHSPISSCLAIGLGIIRKTGSIPLKGGRAQVSVRDLSLMASYYFQKFNIKIYVEGLLPLYIVTHSKSTNKMDRVYDEIQNVTINSLLQ